MTLNETDGNWIDIGWVAGIQVQQVQKSLVLQAAWRRALQSSATQVLEAVVQGTRTLQEVVRPWSTPAALMQVEMKAETDVAV
jgi:hypothetical protein